MHRPATVLFFFVAFLLPSLEAEAQTASDPVIASQLQLILDSEFSAQLATGKSFAVVFPDESVWTGVAGMSNIETQDPIRPDHNFGFASITKTFASAAIMKLVEDGVVSLDDPISRWVSPITFVNSAITVRQLLGHTSGLYNYTNYPNLLQTLLADTSHVYTPLEVLSTFLGPPVFFAGTGASYSNSNYVMLSMIIEAASGKVTGQFFKEELFEPTGLLNTVFPAYESPKGELAIPWFDFTGDGIADNYSGFFESTSVMTTRGTAGSIVSTASDIAKWGAALFGGDVLAQGSLTEIVTFHNLAGQNATWTGYGLGAQRYNFGGIEAWGHSGLVTGETSLLVYSPEMDVSIAMVDNNARSNHFSSANALLSYLSSITFTGVEDDSVPADFEVDVYPNPGFGSETITFEANTLPGTDISLTVYDVLGRRVYSANGLSEGFLEWTPDGSIPGGVYFYSLISGAEILKTGMVVRTH